MSSWRVSAAALVLAFVCAPAVAAGVEGDLGVDLELGHDSNPLTVSGDAKSGAYAEVGLDAGFRIDLHRRVVLFADLDGSARAYESGRSDAGEQRLVSRAGIVMTPHHSADRKLTLALGGLYGIDRSTFTDPVTGDPYRLTVSTPTGPVAGEAIPGRFDRNDSGTFLDLRWKASHRVRLSLESEVRNNDYTEEYDSGSDLHSLDHRSRSIRPGILFRIGKTVWVELTGSRTDREYRHQPARDPEGEEVPGTLRDFRYTGWSLSLRLAPGSGWRSGFGMVASIRDDLHAGYYDSTGWIGYAWTGRDLGEKARLQCFGSWRELEYDRAVVASDPDGDLRGSETLKFIGRYERKITEHLNLYLEAGTERSEDRDPVYTYDRNWASSGFRFRVDRGGS